METRHSPRAETSMTKVCPQVRGPVGIESRSGPASDLSAPGPQSGQYREPWELKGVRTMTYEIVTINNVTHSILYTYYTVFYRYSKND